MLARYYASDITDSINKSKYLTVRELSMDATVGLILVIGFPLALCAILWVFGKVSVRPD